MQDWGTAPSKRGYPTICQRCGSDFMGAKLSKWCSDTCYSLAHQARRKERELARRQKVCGNCGTGFQATRRDAAYCGSSCRQAAYRNRVTDKPSGKIATTESRNG